MAAKNIQQTCRLLISSINEIAIVNCKTECNCKLYKLKTSEIKARLKRNNDTTKN